MTSTTYTDQQKACIESPSEVMERLTREFNAMSDLERAVYFDLLKRERDKIEAASRFPTPAPDAKDAQGEPVAQWQWKWVDDSDSEWRNSTKEDCDKAALNPKHFKVRALYERPLPRASDAPATAAHAGAMLTDEEIVDYWLNTPRGVGSHEYHGVLVFARALLGADVPEGCTPADAKMLRAANHELAAENEMLQRRLRPFAVLVGTGELSWAMVEYCIKDDPEKQTFQAPQMQRAFNRAAIALRERIAAPTPVADSGAISEETLTELYMRAQAQSRQHWIENAQVILAAAKPVSVDSPTAAVDDRKIADTVNQLRDIAIQYRDTQQLRERIAHVVVPPLRASMPERKAVTDERIRELWDECWSNDESGSQNEVVKSFAHALLATTASDSATPQEKGEAKS